MRAEKLASALHRNVKSGELITFGRYPQTADGVDRTPITWRVLDQSGMELLILSESILDCKRYYREFAEITWRDCDLRTWLSEEFYQTAFNPTEQEIVRTTRCTDNGEGRPDTDDKVFLLSVAEVKRLSDIFGKDWRRAVGTEYAKVKKADGCHLYVYDKSIDANYVTDNGKRIGCSWWWLRTQPGETSRAAFIGTRASIRSYGRANLPYYGVRPALKLDLERLR